MATVYKQLTHGHSSKDKGDGESAGASEKPVQNKQKVLMLSSRGITYRYPFLAQALSNPEGNDIL
jgi:hypothetical protein